MLEPLAKQVTTPSRLALYTRLYDEGQAIIDVLNPCNHQWTAKGVHTCQAGERAAKACCARCEHLDALKGCTAISLPCKLYLCDEVSRWHPYNPHATAASIFASRLLDLLRKEAYEARIHLGWRQTMKDFR